jgi:hypothetical protein
MTTSALARMSLIGGLALLVLGEGCGHPPPEGYGNADILATVPSDVMVKVLDFRISAPHGVLASGQIHARHAQNEFEQLVTHVPASDDAHVDVTGKATDGKTNCTGSAPIEVLKGVTTRVHVSVQCRGVNDGMIHISVGLACPPTPQLVSYMISPLSASVGGTVDVAAIDQDTDAGTLAYVWLASTGTFADPSSAATTYQCAAPGPVSMTLVVSTGDCQETHVITDVTCSGLDGGQD